MFQINVVSAALKDIGNDASIFGEATTTSFKAINEATEKNNALNDTLKANLNSLVVSATSLGEKIGQLTFAPLLGSLVGIGTTLAEGLDKALDPEKGNKFVQGLFKIIGGFISGPGLALFTLAFVKIFKTVLRFAREGFKTVMEMGSAAERVKNIEGGIVGLLQKDAGLRKKLVSTTATQAQKEQAVIAAIKKENSLLTQQEQLVRRIAKATAARGVRGYGGSTGFTGKRGKRFAAGGEGQMEPNLMTAMAKEARDAPSGASPFVTNFRGNPAVMNTSEMQVRINGREQILREDQIPRFNKGSGKKNKFKGPKAGATGTKVANDKEFGDRFVMLTPKIDERSHFGPMTVDDKKHKATHQVHGIKSSQIKKASDKEENSLEKRVKDNLFKEAADWTSRIKPLDKSAPVSEIAKGFDSTRGAKGALQAAIGSAFEVGISKSLKYEARERDQGGDFDVRGGPNISQIQKLFGIRQTIGDFKNASSDGNKRSFVRKVRREKLAGAFTKEEADQQAAKAADKKGTNLRSEKRKAYSAQRASRMPNLRRRVPTNAKGSLPNLKLNKHVPNYAAGSLIRPLLGLLKGGGRSSKLLGGGARKASFGKRAKHLVGRGVEGAKQRVKGSGSLGASIGLSMLSTQLQEANKAIEGEAITTKQALTTVGTEMASFAATGAAIGGPIGAAAGALVGLGIGLFKNKSALEEYGAALKANEEKQKKLQKITIAQSEGFQGRSKDTVMSQLSKVGGAGFENLDLRAPLQNLENQLKALTMEAPTEERGQDQIDKEHAATLVQYTKKTKEAGAIAAKTGEIIRKVNKVRELEAKILKFKSQNEGKALKSAVAKQRSKLDDASDLMKGVQGPFAGIINRDLDVGKKQTDAADARGDLEDLKTQLRVTQNPTERLALNAEINKASENFSKKVKDAAIFMVQKQTEIANRQAEVAKESAKLQTEAIQTAISGISKGVRGEKINLNNISDFRKDFKGAKTDEDKAKLIAEFEGTTLSGLSEAMKEALRKAAGLASGDSRELIGESGLTSLNESARIEGGDKLDKKSRDDIYNSMPSKANDKRRNDLDQIAAALKTQADGLATKMKDFGKAFQAEAVTAEMAKVGAALNKAAENAEALAGATGVVTSIATKVNGLITRVDVNLDVQAKRLDVLEGQRDTTNAQVNDMAEALAPK